MDYITTTELCNKLKVTRQCIYEWRKQGLPCYKIGRLVRFKIDEVEAWIKTSR